MTLSRVLFLVLSGLSASAQAGPYEICRSDDGAVTVENGNVTINEGIGDVGPAKFKASFSTLSETSENCVDGPNYVYTVATREVVVFDIEENVEDSAIVECVATRTGPMNPALCSN